MNKTGRIATGVVIALFLLLGGYAVTKSPPRPVPPHEHEEESNVVEDVLAQIDTASAREILLFVSDMATPKCVQEITEGLRALGSVGKVTIDLQQQLYRIQYDPSKTDESKVIQTVAASGHTPAKKN